MTICIGCKSANAKIENWYGMGFLVITFELRTVRISFKSNKSWCGCQFLFYYILKKNPHFLNKYRQHIAMTMNKFSGDVFTKIMWNGWLDIFKNGLFGVKLSYVKIFRGKNSKSKTLFVLKKNKTWALFL